MSGPRGQKPGLSGIGPHSPRQRKNSKQACWAQKSWIGLRAPCCLMGYETGGAQVPLENVTPMPPCSPALTPARALHSLPSCLLGSSVAPRAWRPQQIAGVWHIFRISEHNRNVKRILMKDCVLLGIDRPTQNPNFRWLVLRALGTRGQL
jgi:hypothetical protein